MPAFSNVTTLLADWHAGNETARDALVEIVYDELHRLAQIYLSRERRDHTLQPTALVNEAYLKLIDSRAKNYENRAHFVGTAANAMRQILVDYARATARNAAAATNVGCPSRPPTNSSKNPTLI